MEQGLLVGVPVCADPTRDQVPFHNIDRQIRLLHGVVKGCQEVEDHLGDGTLLTDHFAGELVHIELSVGHLGRGHQVEHLGRAPDDA